LILSLKYLKENSLYAGGIFQLEILLPLDYPWKPPKIRFLTQIYHSCVGKNGVIGLGELRDNWSPALTIAKSKYLDLGVD